MKLKSMSNKDRYGNMFSIEFFETDTSVPAMMEVPHPGGPKGTDTVPAWLTPGENVVNAEASRLPGNQEMIDQMNEEGRMIQKAQGGPIPTYEADGGMVYASGGTKSNLPITTRVMPNGKIGLWRGNTYLGIKEEKPSVFKEISDSFKDSGWNPFKADGGEVPPMYSAAGDFVTDSLLDRIRRIESGGDPNAISEAGAMGQYQIMPSTAAQPGYGVTPLAAEDIRDPAKSREFARQYLMGIAAANPDFTEDEVITAYHSGAGNVRKAKEGKEALGPRGQAYAGKIANAPAVSNASSVGPDAFGIKRRQVATVPNPNTTPPTPREDNIGFWDFITTPTGELKEKTGRTLWETLTTPTNELKYKGDPSKVNTSEDSKLFDLDQIQRAAQYPLEMFGVPVDADAPGKEVPSIFDILPEDPGMTNVNAAIVKNDTENEARLADLINQKKANNETVTPELVQMHKDAVKKLADSKATQEKELAERAKVTKEDTEAKEAAQTYVPELGKSVPTPEDYDYSAFEKDDKGNLTGKTQAEADKIKAAEAAAAAAKGAADIKDNNKDITDAGADLLTKDPTFAEEIKQGFIDLFGEMFSPKEIARMVVNYAGSRALGYDHGASLKYSAQTYAKTITKDLADRKAFTLNKDNLKLYTKASLKDYQETGDINKLIEKTAPLNIKKATGSFYVTGVGQMQAWEDDKGVQYIKVPGGGYKKASELGDLVQPYDKDVFGDKAVISSFSNYAEAAVAPANDKAGLTADDKNLVKINKQKLGEQANSIYRDILRSNGININNSDQIRQGIQAGIDSYMDAQAQYNKSGKQGTSPGNLESYIREQMITPLTGIDQVQITGTSPQNLKKLDDSVRRDMDIKNPRDPGYAEEYRAEWQAINLAWSDKLGDAERAEAANQARKRNEKAETPQWSAFTWWAANTPADEINALLAGKK